MACQVANIFCTLDPAMILFIETSVFGVSSAESCSVNSKRCPLSLRFFVLVYLFSCLPTSAHIHTQRTHP